jgi:hypothetical protein
MRTARRRRRATFARRSGRLSAIAAGIAITVHDRPPHGRRRRGRGHLSCHQCAPATLNYRDPDPEINLNVVHGSSRSMPIRYAMSDNVGLGGHNGAVIFKRYDGD